MKKRSTFGSMSAQRSQIQGFACKSCGWLGGSVMLADVSFASSHSSATLTVAFDYTYSFITHLDQDTSTLIPK